MDVLGAFLTTAGLALLTVLVLAKAHISDFGSAHRKFQKKSHTPAVIIPTRMASADMTYLGVYT
jgi:hypothetical protein